jgi:hypothetical protein
MTRVITLEVTEEAYRPMVQAAEQAGQKLEEWALARLQASAPSAEARQAALARLLRHAGAVDLGRPTGADNSSIDADLAREYGGTAEEPR